MDYKDNLKGTALEDMKIKALKTASLEFTLKHSEGEETREMDVLLGKIGRSWYVINWQNL